MHFATSERMTGSDAQTRDNNTMHTEPRVARLFLLARLSPRPGDRCRYHSLMLVQCGDMLVVVVEVRFSFTFCTATCSCQRG